VKELLNLCEESGDDSIFEPTDNEAPGERKGYEVNTRASARSESLGNRRQPTALCLDCHRRNQVESAPVVTGKYSARARAFWSVLAQPSSNFTRRRLKI